MRLYGFLYLLAFSLYSSSLTDCDLIPNNKVIADGAEDDDFNLVEGITYNIVHLKSSLNLDSDGDKVHISSPEHNGINNPFQFWALRKADNSYPIGRYQVYNIIHVQSGRNLDCNGAGDKFSISTPPNNSKTNPYQHWIFIKISDNVYNIVHVMTDFRNLDSDGEGLEISSPEHNSVNNPFQYWSFRPLNYQFSTVITDVVYPKDLNSTLDKYKQNVYLFEGNYIIDNPTNAIVQHTIDKAETKSNTYAVEIKKVETFQTSETNEVSFNIGLFFLGKFGINTGIAKEETKYFETTTETTYQEIVTENVTYHVQQTITVPAFTSIAVEATVDKVNVKIPYQAKYKVTAEAMRLDENGVSITAITAEVGVDALRCYLQNGAKNPPKNAKLVGNSLVFDTSGSITLDAYGINTVIKTRPI